MTDLLSWRPGVLAVNYAALFRVGLFAFLPGLAIGVAVPALILRRP